MHYIVDSNRWTNISQDRQNT